MSTREAALVAEAEQTLERVAAAVRAAGVADVSTLVVEGDAGAAIVDTAQREGCAAIVMATNGFAYGGWNMLRGAPDRSGFSMMAPELIVLVRKPVITGYAAAEK